MVVLVAAPAVATATDDDLMADELASATGWEFRAIVFVSLLVSFDRCCL